MGEIVKEDKNKEARLKKLIQDIEEYRRNKEALERTDPRTKARSIAYRQGIDTDEAKKVIREQRSPADTVRSMERRIASKGRDLELTDKNRKIVEEIRREMLEEKAGNKPSKGYGEEFGPELTDEIKEMMKKRLADEVLAPRLQRIAKKRKNRE